MQGRGSAEHPACNPQGCGTGTVLCLCLLSHKAGSRFLQALPLSSGTGRWCPLTHIGRFFSLAVHSAPQPLQILCCYEGSQPCLVHGILFLQAWGLVEEKHAVYSTSHSEGALIFYHQRILTFPILYFLVLSCTEAKFKGKKGIAKNIV